MELTKEYIALQEDTIKRNFDTHFSFFKNPYIKNRYLALREFCQGCKTILSVGSGGVEPIAINATHACDVSKIAGDLLKKQGWKGVFFISSCDDIDKSVIADGYKFDVAVCSEVIEHLPDLEIVKKTFLELDRVAKKWIVTTPNADVVKPESQDKSHINFWNVEKIRSIIPASLLPQLKIQTKRSFIYISKNPE